jgi:hypothetical protein
MLSFKLLLQNLEPLTKRDCIRETLDLLTTVRTVNDQHILGSFVVVAGFQLLQFIASFEYPKHFLVTNSLLTDLKDSEATLRVSMKLDEVRIPPVKLRAGE